MSHRPVKFAILLLLVTGSLPPLLNAGTVTDGVTTRTYAEDFESFLGGQQAGDTWYTVSTAGSGTFAVNAATPVAGAKDYEITPTNQFPSASAAGVLFNVTPAEVTLCNTNQVLTFKWRITAPISLGETYTFRARAGGTASTSTGTGAVLDAIGFQLVGANGAETITPFIVGSDGSATSSATTNAYVAGAIADVTISQVNCSGAQFCASIQVTNVTAPVNANLCDNSLPTSTDISNVGLAYSSTIAPGSPMEVDNLQWAGVVYPAPTATSVSPATGPLAGGNGVTITGTGFRAGATVSFGSTAATNVAVASSTTITATVPAHSAGAVSVVVTNTDGRTGTCSSCYTYQAAAAPAPFMTALNPNSGPAAGGTVVNITGGNFVAGATVKFDTTFGQATVISGSLVQAITPQHATGGVGVTITNPDGQVASCSACYTYTATPGPGGDGDDGQPDPPAFTGSTNVSLTSNSGRQPSMDYADGVLGIAHVAGAGSAIFVSVSTDKGATWNEYATGALYTADDRFFFAIQDADSWAVLHCNGGVILTVYATNDGGTAWTPTTIESGDDMADGCAIRGIAAGYVVMALGSPGGLKRYNAYTSTNGTGWTQTANQVSHFGAGSANDYPGLDIAEPQSLTTWTWASTVSGTSDLTDICTTTDAGATLGTCQTAQDIGTPVGSHRNVRISEDAKYITFETPTSPIKKYVGYHTSASTWHFFNYVTESPSLSGLNNYPVDVTNCGVDAGFDYGLITSFPGGTSFNGDPQVVYGKLIPSTSSQINLPELLTAVNGSFARNFINLPAITNDGQGALYFAYQDNATQRLMLQKRINCSATGIAGGGDPAASVEVPGLVAFKVDPTGQQVLIARYDDPANTPNDGGNEVATYEPGTLALKATTETACGTLAGIDALPTHVAFTGCDVQNPTDVDQIYIRNPFLDSPSLNGCSWCRGSIDEGDNNINLPNNIDRLATVSQYPYTFTGLTRVNNAGNYVVVAFPFTELATGMFGIYAVKFFNNGLDSDSTERFQYAAAGTTISALCSWRGASGTDYIAVAEPSVGLKVYTFSIDHDESLDDNDITITQFLSAPNDLIKAESLGCADNVLLVSTFDGKVGAYYVEGDDQGHVAGQLAWPVKSAVVTQPNGVALSSSSEYGGFWDNGFVKILNMSNGNISASIDVPAGANKGLAIDRANNNLWVGIDPGATAQRAIYRYDIVELTDGDGTLDTNPDPFSTNPQICDDNPGASECLTFCQSNPESDRCTDFCTANPTHEFCVDYCTANPDALRCINAPIVCSSPVCISEDSVPPGFTKETFNGFMGVLLALGVGIIIAAGFKGSIIAGGIGMLAGMLIAVFFGMIGIWVIVALVVISVAIIFVGVRVGR